MQEVKESKFSIPGRHLSKMYPKGKWTGNTWRFVVRGDSIVTMSVDEYYKVEEFRTNQYDPAIQQVLHDAKTGKLRKLGFEVNFFPWEVVDHVNGVWFCHNTPQCEGWKRSTPLGHPCWACGNILR